MSSPCDTPDCLRRPLMGVWFSTTQTSPNVTNGFLTTSADMQAEMQRLGQASASMAGVWDLNSTDPYPARLRRMTSLDTLRQARVIWISSINFHAIDTTYYVGGVAGTGQDLATVQAIVASQSTPKNAYAQARTINTVIGGWQPNWFRPKVFVDGIDILSEVGTNGFTMNNQADLSVGLPLPFCWQPFIPYGVKSAGSIDVWAPAAQFISETGKFQRYPVECTIEFLWI